MLVAALYSNVQACPVTIDRLYTGALRWQVRGQEARPILVSHKPKLLRISFPQLEVLNTGLWIQKNDKLQSINLDSLKSGLCGQFFVIRFHPSLGKGGLHADGLVLIANDRCSIRIFT